jgi:hypothetical protein
MMQAVAFIVAEVFVLIGRVLVLGQVARGVIPVQFGPIRPVLIGRIDLARLSIGNCRRRVNTWL